jgi:UDP-2,4-diacetamido-2,4,6-trideoxy-beta-L-altropyranose hydrolase
MRCLTLANAFTAKGFTCHFFCREHVGNLITLIEKSGFKVHYLPHGNIVSIPSVEVLGSATHASWLGVDQDTDSAHCLIALGSIKPKWLVVDHYSLDSRWEKVLRPMVGKVMVIDDLADRQHDCDLLLDQTFGRKSKSYASLVQEQCRLLCGSEYALLRPEFERWRAFSLQRRKSGTLEHLIVNLGGVDKDNVTKGVLCALQECALPKKCEITVVMGATSPWVDLVNEQARLMSWPTIVKVGVSNMAELLANSDLAIGAAGATTWERCCLGLPTIMLVVADNQLTAAKLLKKTKSVLMLAESSSFENGLKLSILRLIDRRSLLSETSNNALSIVDGKGCSRVVDIIATLS